MAFDPLNAAPSQRLAWGAGEEAEGWFVGVRKLGLAALVLSLALLLAGLVACQSHVFNGTEYDNPEMAADFSLRNVEGGEFRLSDRGGEYMLIYFGYTSCPDVCPATLAQAKQIFDGLGDEAKLVRLLFITVDPERDTPEVMANYISVFHPNIIGLTGDPGTLEQVFQDYGIVAEREALPDSAVGYVMNHTTRLFLVDSEGRLRLSWSFGTPPADIIEDLIALMEGK